LKNTTASTSRIVSRFQETILYIEKLRPSLVFTLEALQDILDLLLAAGALQVYCKHQYTHLQTAIQMIDEAKEHCVSLFVGGLIELTS
jgi:hypothetical protein